MINTNDINNIPRLLKEKREPYKISIRRAAKEIGITGSTLLRIEAGEDYYVSNLIKILKWLETKNES